MRDPTKTCSIRSICGRKIQRAQKGAGLTFDGEDFYPEEFNQKQHEFTREEEQVSNAKNKRDAERQNRIVSPVQAINREESIRRSQALENMTEQLQGNLNDGEEDEEYDDRDERVISPAENDGRQQQPVVINSRRSERADLLEGEIDNNELENSQTFLNPPD